MFSEMDLRNIVNRYTIKKFNNILMKWRMIARA